LEDEPSFNENPNAALMWINQSPLLKWLSRVTCSAIRATKNPRLGSERLARIDVARQSKKEV
jgi:hypothetical protein